MPGTTDVPAPSYISSHSADVILSEVRPIKLKIDALRSINVLLDEFLYNILSTASSLSTDRLRASLLSLLPTALGKEALLEAEVELRAYWERTGPTNATLSSFDNSAKVFHLQWVYKLLRLKCEAYSTLNECDEDPKAEEHILTMMSSAGSLPPKPTMVAPAALYLTAILEALCEHILSNVGRVAARDSSRNNATAQDLFVALCEDHSIYTLFKNMKVYEEIEQLSKAPKLRRSKSLTRSDRAHAGSPHPDPSTVKDGSPARLSSEGDGMTTTIPVTNPRSSTDRTKAIKMFMNNSRPSVERDREGQTDHRRSDSAVSEPSWRHGTPPLNNEALMAFDDELQQEFDDLMRSSATMKVSLTPDRLKTMEVYKQERDRRGNRRLAPLSFQTNFDPSSAPPRAITRRPSLLRVDSIKEDEEENITKPPPPFPQSRDRQNSLSSTLGSTLPGGRARSTSAASRVSKQESAAKSTPPPAYPGKAMQANRRALAGQDPYPTRTRKVQQHRESIDLDDVLAGADEEDVSLPKTPKSQTVTSPGRPGQHTVSAGTRELMDFLAAGPPNLGPPITSLASEGFLENGKSKGSGRLQRMISKLSLSNGDRSKSASDDFSRSKSAQTPTRQTLSTKSSLNNMSYLANRPIPPRLPRPRSPTDSSSQAASRDTSYSTPRSRSGSLLQTRQKSVETQSTEPPPPPPRDHADKNTPIGQQKSTLPNGNVNQIKNGRTDSTEPPAPTSPRAPNTVTRMDFHTPPPTSTSRAQSTPASPQPRHRVPESVTNVTQPNISRNDAKELRRLLSYATNADECRLILDMFLAKSGLLVECTKSSPPASIIHCADVIAMDAVENTIVELFLDGGNVEHSDEPRS